MTTQANMPLPTVIEQTVALEPIAHDDVVDDLRGALAELERPAGEQVHCRRATRAHDRAPARPRRALVE